MKARIRLTESQLGNLIERVARRVINETEDGYEDEDLIDDEFDDEYEDEYGDREGFLDNPEDADEIERDLEDVWDFGGPDEYDEFPSLRKADETGTGVSMEDLENDYSWNLFNKKHGK